jgi:hypothetical protein
MPGGRNDPKEWEPVDLADISVDDGALKAPWKYVLSNKATYSEEIFAKVSIELIFHPERNSKSIRRADILSDDHHNDGASSVELLKDVHVEEMKCVRRMRRRLMPRNPNLDGQLEQMCYLFAIRGNSTPSLVLYLSEFHDGNTPYYAPDVRGIAYELRQGNLYLAILPLPEKVMDDKLKRICLNLVRTMHRHWYYTFWILLM